MTLPPFLENTTSEVEESIYRISGHNYYTGQCSNNGK